VEGGIPAAILFVLFFKRAFSNLRILLKRKDLNTQMVLFVGALHSSMVGFIVGAMFAPEAYQFFPYFAVAYTSALIAIVKEQDDAPESALPQPAMKRENVHIYRRHGPKTPVGVVR
jgi:uncharacterized membrane protein YfcA